MNTCTCDPGDAALAEVRYYVGVGVLRAVCALCGATRSIPPATTEDVA